MGTLELFDITRYVSEKNVEILRGGICCFDCCAARKTNRSVRQEHPGESVRWAV